MKRLTDEEIIQAYHGEAYTKGMPIINLDGVRAVAEAQLLANQKEVNDIFNTIDTLSSIFPFENIRDLESYALLKSKYMNAEAAK